MYLLPHIHVPLADKKALDVLQRTNLLYPSETCLLMQVRFSGKTV